MHFKQELLGNNRKKEIQEMAKLYAYGMRLRGFSIGCQPLRGLIEYEPDKSGKYYDILYYGRELTKKEVEDYELDRIEE